MGKRKNGISMILLIVFCFVFVFMCVGYAAFQTQIYLNTKGNIKEMTASKYLKDKVVTSGDGLYQDSVEPNKYFYRGKNPNNYVKFNDEIWRILSINEDGTLKIINNNSAIKSSFDDNWETSALNKYLNSNYYNGISTTFKKLIASHTWNVGNVSNEEEKNELKTLVGEDYSGDPSSWMPINKIVHEEKAATWYGNIALVNISEFLRTNSNVDVCSSLGSSYKSFLKKDLTCAKTLWINWDENPWLLSEYYSGSKGLHTSVSDYASIVEDTKVTLNGKVIPALYLRDDVRIINGIGSEIDPYILK